MSGDRYIRQKTFYGIGEKGQSILKKSRVLIIGVGALGSVILNNLSRAGVGFIRIIDRDYVDITNLGRQILFTEEDALENIPKVNAAANHIKKINSEITVEPISDDVNNSNIETYIKDVDLVLDGTDSFELRFLINEACHKNKKKWIYGGVIGAGGGTMNILEGGPCFRCFIEDIPEIGTYDTCVTEGVIAPITSIIGSYQSAEAIKILLNSDEVSNKYIAIDLWDNILEYIQIDKNPDCPVCGQGKYEMLDDKESSGFTSICGSDSVQILPVKKTQVNFTIIEERLEKLGNVKANKFLLSFENSEVSFKLFPDGRAIINNTTDENVAKKIYTDYIGL